MQEIDFTSIISEVVEEDCREEASKIIGVSA